MKIDIRFSSGMILNNYEVMEVKYDETFENLLKLFEYTGAITYVNMDNVDIFTVYVEGVKKNE